jgi:sialic acid synthase SpsE
MHHASTFKIRVQQANFFFYVLALLEKSHLDLLDYACSKLKPVIVSTGVAVYWQSALPEIK